MVLYIVIYDFFKIIVYVYVDIACSCLSIHYIYLLCLFNFFVFLLRIVRYFFPNAAIPSRGAIIFRTESRFFFPSFFTTGPRERIARRVRGREGRSYRNTRG